MHPAGWAREEAQTLRPGAKGYIWAGGILSCGWQPVSLSLYEPRTGGKEEYGLYLYVLAYWQRKSVSSSRHGVEVKL